MKKRYKRIISLLVAALLLTASVGCAPVQEAQGTNACLELVDSPATTLDNLWYNPGGIFRCAVFESLLIPNADMNAYEYALAKTHSVSEDGRTWYFQLRDDVTWHDGEAFDAEDVVFSLEAALRCRDLNGLLASALPQIEGAEAFMNGETDTLQGVTVDRANLVIRLTSPSGNFLSAMAQFAILPEHLLGSVDPKKLSEQDYWKHPIGCGPYRVTEAVEGEYFMLEANRDYYGVRPGIDRIRLRLNEQNCVEAMQEGRLDFYITNDPEEIAELKGIEACSEHRLNILFPAYLILNLRSDEDVHPSLTDVRVRKALLLALDRETITNAIFPGSSVTDTLVPSWDPWYLEEREAYRFDPDEAVRLLEEAEFDFSVPLRLRYSTKGQSTVDLMNAIAVYWRAIGIQVNVEKFEGSGSSHMFQIRDFDVCYKRLSAFDHASIYDEVHGDGVMQTNLFRQPVYDPVIGKLQSAMGEAERWELIRQMQELDQEHLLRLPLFALANVAYVNDRNFDMPDAYGNLWYRYDLRFEDWKLLRE